MCWTFRKEQGLGKQKIRPLSPIVLLESRNVVVHRCSVVVAQTHKDGCCQKKSKGGKEKVSAASQIRDLVPKCKL